MASPSALDLLRELVELESPTGHSEGLRAVAERVAAELEPHGGEATFTDDHLRVELPGEGEPLLLLGHVDTVWEVGTLAGMPFRVENGRAYGPGAYDMKAGLVVLVEALRKAGDRRRAGAAAGLGAFGFFGGSGGGGGADRASRART